MQPRQILHCDCNCFYAAVEAQEHPEYRGKQIAVCGNPQSPRNRLNGKLSRKAAGRQNRDGNMAGAAALPGFDYHSTTL